MQLRKSSRKKAKIRLGLQGPSGSGKTYSALLIAFGLCGQWQKITVIDSESNSADLYSHLGPFNVVSISEPFSPEKYIDAIHLCEQAGSEVIIVDSASHEWEGAGGIIETSGNMPGNSFANWAKLTPRHNSFIQAMLQSPCHVITTIRTKQDYVLNEKNGKQVPEKVGLKGVQRDGLEYDFTLMFDLNMKNQASTSKDRTGLFFGKPEQVLSAETGQTILNWCNEGSDPDKEVKEILIKVQAATTVEELISLFKANPQYQDQLLPHFSKRRNQLGVANPIFDQSKTSDNGDVNF